MHKSLIIDTRMAWHFEGGSETRVLVHSELEIVPGNTFNCQCVASNEHTPFQPGVHVCFEHAPKTLGLTLYNVSDTNREQALSTASKQQTKHQCQLCRRQTIISNTREHIY